MASENGTQRRPGFRFPMVGIKPGEVVVFKNDERITAEVANSKKVWFNGEQVTLSGLTKRLRGVPTASGPDFWLYKGKTLTQLRMESEGLNPEPNGDSRYKYKGLSCSNFPELEEGIGEWANMGYKAIFVQGVANGTEGATKFVALMEKSE